MTLHNSDPKAARTKARKASRVAAQAGREAQNRALRNGGLTPWEKSRLKRRQKRADLPIQTRSRGSNIVYGTVAVTDKGTNYAVTIVSPGNGTLPRWLRAMFAGHIPYGPTKPR